MYRAVRAASKTCNRFCSLPTIKRRSFALVNDYSVRKRMTIGLSGFAVVATGTYFGCRTLYRSRKAKRIARAEAIAASEASEHTILEEEEVFEKDVKPVIDAPVKNAVVSEDIEEQAEKSVVEEKETVQEEVKEEEEVEEEETSVENDVEVGEVLLEEVDEPEEEDVYHPWWEGVKEIGLYLPADDIEKLNSLFPATCKYKPTPKVMLSYNPRPEDANEYGPIMGDDIDIKVLAMVSDEHAQVLVIDIGNTECSYRYPHIVLSCDDEERTSAYSPIYGRLLVDRAVTDGLLVEERANVYVPKEEVENVEIEGYYSYPTTYVTVKDLREMNLTLKGKLCTSRGMNEETYACSEGKNDHECSWCVFMKSGPCFKPFSVWQKCILENQEDSESFIENCGECTMVLKDCVDAHPEYYGKMSQPKEAPKEAAPAVSTEEAVDEVTEEQVIEEVVEEDIPVEEVVEEVTVVDISQDQVITSEELKVELPQEEKEEVM